jgi:hypothetical protein
MLSTLSVRGAILALKKITEKLILQEREHTYVHNVIAQT